MSRTVLLSLLSLVGVVRAQDAAPIPVLIVTGANNHDWEWTAPELKRLLEDSGRFTADITTEPAKTLADADALARYRAFVLDYNGPRWGEPADSNFIAAVRGGTGVAVIHASNNPFPGWADYEQMVALCWRQGTGHGAFHTFDVVVTDHDHPITKGMPDMIGHPDELYHRLVNVQNADFHLLADALSSKESGGTGEREPMVLVHTFGKGRVFHTPLGHVWRNMPGTRASYADPRFRQLVARGTEWAATGNVTLSPEPPENVVLPSEAKEGFRLLFDGKTGHGWRGYKEKTFPAQGWVIADGCLEHKAGGGGGDLLTDAQFGNFELRFEWSVAPGANSGVIYRCTEDQDTTWQSGPEYQVIDDGDQPKHDVHSASALYDLAEAKPKLLRPPGQWNTGRIVVDGTHIEHWLNGVKVVDVRTDGPEWQARIQHSKFASMPAFAKAERGHIALQDHGDAVRYRSLRIRELP